MLVDPDAPWTVDPTQSASRSRNTPFAGRRLPARVVATLPARGPHGPGRQAGVILAAKTVLVDPHPFWGGLVVAIIASAIFVVFAAWIVVQRVRHGRGGDDD